MWESPCEQVCYTHKPAYRTNFHLQALTSELRNAIPQAGRRREDIYYIINNICKSKLFKKNPLKSSHRIKRILKYSYSYTLALHTRQDQEPGQQKDTPMTQDGRMYAFGWPLRPLWEWTLLAATELEWCSNGKQNYESKEELEGRIPSTSLLYEPDSSLDEYYFKNQIKLYCL